MSVELRKCKECGKLFAPKGRESYCSDTHYRPCPICGKPVEVKYLSDPPRKCDECKWRKIKPLPTTLSKDSKSLFNIIPKEKGPSGMAQLKAEIDSSDKQTDGLVSSDWMNDVDIMTHTTTIDAATFCEQVSGSVMVYIGNTHNNCFKKGHKYLLKVERNDYVYDVTSTEDITSGEPCDIFMPLASQISFYQNFASIRKHSAGKGHTY